MPATYPFASNGSRFVVGSNSPLSTSSRVYSVPAIEVTSISLSGVNSAEIDVTSLLDSWKQYVLGTLDVGSMDVSGLASPSAVPLPQSGAAVPLAFQIIFGKAKNQSAVDADGTVRVDVWGFLKTVSVESAVDDAIRVNLAYRLTHGISIYTRNAGDSAWVRITQIGLSFDEAVGE